MHSNVRHAKIVCTLGPSSRSPEMIDRLALAGMDVVRLNFSHGTHEVHARTIEHVRAVSRKYQKPMAVIADLQGPKIRTGALAGGSALELKAGQAFTLTTRATARGPSEVNTNYRRLPKDVRKGDRVLLADGLIELRVLSCTSTDVRCEVLNGGLLGEHKGINLPGVSLRVDALTPKDRADLAFALERGVNYVAVSFVRGASDVRAAQAAMRRLGRYAPLISKLEKTEALENLEDILRVSDGIMVARGDLGVEMSPEKVPVAQKLIITRAREHRLPVITATQMLESMTRQPRPSRAEASDVANAVFDGSGALMLSEETAAGRYPCESVAMMDRIIREAEGSLREQAGAWTARKGPATVAEALGEAVCRAAYELSLRVIAVFTETGTSARLISHYRPPCPIIAFSPRQETRRRLALLWGVLPRKIRPVRNIDELAELTEHRLLEERLAKPGDLVAIVSGTPLGVEGTTNLLKLHVVSR